MKPQTGVNEIDIMKLLITEGQYKRIFLLGEMEILILSF